MDLGGGNYLAIFTSPSVTAQTKCTIEVSVANAGYVSNASSVDVVVTATPPSPAVAPSVPQNLFAEAGDARVTLTWTAPSSDGGSSITNYKVYRGTSAGGEVLLTTLGNVTTYTDTGLTNGQKYYYKVSAVNNVGEGALSSEVSAMPTAPSDNTMLYIGIAIVIAVAIALAALVVMRKKK
jgi:fibronectin type 3 domain-containing protein